MTNSDPYYRVHRERGGQPNPVPALEPLVDDGVEEDLGPEVPAGYDWRGVAVLGLLLTLIGFLCWLYR